MKVNSPDPQPRDNGDYDTYVNGEAYGKPYGKIYLDEGRALALDDITLDDARRLAAAVAHVERVLAGAHAKMSAPHGTGHVYKGTCQLCGKPEADALHAGLCGADSVHGLCIRPIGHLPQAHRTADGWEWGATAVTLPDCARCGQPFAGHGSSPECPAWRSAPGWAMDAPQAAAVLAESIASGTPLAVDDDEPLPACARCGHSGIGHARKDDQPIATGACRHHADCGCSAYTPPQEPVEAADIAFARTHPDPYAAPEQAYCGAERDGRRCKLPAHEGGEHDSGGWRWSDVANSVPHRHSAWGSCPVTGVPAGVALDATGGEW